MNTVHRVKAFYGKSTNIHKVKFCLTAESGGCNSQEEAGWKIPLNRKIIVSTTGRKNNKWIAVFLSLFFTGLGQVYAGYAVQGIVFLLLKILSALLLPFYSLWEDSTLLAAGILTEMVIFILLSMAAALHAFILCVKVNVRSSWYNSLPSYILYGFLSSLLTLLSLIVFFSFFGIEKITDDAAPLMRKGDIIAVKKISRERFSRGELILMKKDGAVKIARIIALPGENVSCEKGRFIVDDYELPLTIFTENELHNLSVSDYDVISEQNGTWRYPVIKGSRDLNMKAVPDEKRYFVSPDDRRDSASMSRVSLEDITARVEGILYSPFSGVLPGEPYLPAETGKR